MRIKLIVIPIYIAFFSLLLSCKESGRFEIGYEDAEPPAAPHYQRYKPTYGGARIFFKKPSDSDLLSIDASYINKRGERMRFSTSFFANYIDVYGFPTQEPITVELY